MGNGSKGLPPDGAGRGPVTAAPVAGSGAQDTSLMRRMVRRVPGTRRLRRRIRDGTPLWVSPVPVQQARDRGPPTTDRDEVLGGYRASEVTEEPDDFVLYRIIGNDLPPRHERGQARRNLDFILDHEPDLPGCEKRFVVNRIVDGEEDQAIVSLLEQAGVRYFRIPFCWEEYARISLDHAGVPGRYVPGSKRHAWLREDERERVLARLYRHKNKYVMNNNGARNAALSEGRSAAKWIMPWDGNCFLSEAAYAEIREAVRVHPEVPYLLVRMVRLSQNPQALDASVSSEAVDEPQIVFRRDAATEFDEAFPYGRRPKVELLWRLGVPGPWDEWGVEPWDLPYPDHHSDAGAFEWAGWVARLTELPTGDGAAPAAATDRTLARTRAIVEFIESLDRRVQQTDPLDNGE